MKFNVLKRNNKSNNQEQRGILYSGFNALNYNTMTSYKESVATQLSAVYRSVEILSNSVATLPIHLYFVDNKGDKKELHNELSVLLNSTPNEIMSRYTFIKMLISSMLLKGNGYALIKRNGDGTPKEIIYLDYELVAAKYNTTTREESYYVNGIGNVNPRDIINLCNFSTNGVIGDSTLTYAATTLSIATEAERNAENFFTKKANLSGIITSSKRIDPRQQEEIKYNWRNLFANPDNNGGVAVLGDDMKFQTITVSPLEQQLLETRRFSVHEIARFFGVNPHKLFSSDTQSYNSIEAENLSFLSDTLQPLITKIENEFERKLFTNQNKGKYDIKFDTEELLRTDKNTQAEYYTKLFNIGVLSINEIRSKLDMKPIENGDYHFMQVNISTVDNIANMQVKDNPSASNVLKSDDLTNNTQEETKSNKRKKSKA